MTLLMRIATLTLVYCLALGSFKPADVAIGVVLSAAVVVATRRFLPEGRAGLAEVVWRVPVALAIVAMTAREVVTGSWQVALMVLGLRPLGRPGLVEIPLEGRTERGVVVTAIVVTLPPGDVYVDVDWERDVMIVHVLDAGDPDEVRARYSRFYNRWQKRVAP